MHLTVVHACGEGEHPDSLSVSVYDNYAGRNGPYIAAISRTAVCSSHAKSACEIRLCNPLRRLLSQKMEGELVF